LHAPHQNHRDAGAASDTDETIRALIDAGTDVFRLNFSTARTTRTPPPSNAFERRLRRGRSVALMQDLSGPKIRTGTLRGGAPLSLASGDTLRVAIGDGVGEPGRV
jgi:pyruvate kinase